MKKIDFEILLSIKPSDEEPSLGDMVFEYYRTETYAGSKEELETKMDDYIDRLYVAFKGWS